MAPAGLTYWRVKYSTLPGLATGIRSSALAQVGARCGVDHAPCSNEILSTRVEYTEERGLIVWLSQRCVIWILTFISYISSLFFDLYGFWVLLVILSFFVVILCTDVLCWTILTFSTSGRFAAAAVVDFLGSSVLHQCAGCFLFDVLLCWTLPCSSSCLLCWTSPWWLSCLPSRVAVFVGSSYSLLVRL